MKPADWELWGGAGKVTVGQAVWLSIGLEPMGGYGDDDPAISSEYRKRLAIASSWMDELPHDEGASSYVGSWRVNLAQFGFVAMARGWTLPAEFPVSDGLPEDEPAPAESPSKPEPRQTEINRWLRDTWEAENCPGGAEFFLRLKRYKGKPGSPIREWHQSGKDAGIDYEISTGVRDSFTRKSLQNKVSEWKQAAAASDCP